MSPEPEIITQEINWNDYALPPRPIKKGPAAFARADSESSSIGGHSTYSARPIKPTKPMTSMHRIASNDDIEIVF
jgi:hypothetical protein